jgi:predicted acetyltransferase
MNDIATENLKLILEASFPGDPDKGSPPSYRFLIVLSSTSERIGHITVRVGNDEILREYSGHVSFAILPAHRGHRYAAEACRAVVPLADSLGIKPIRITCDLSNVASARTCELAGGDYLGDVEVPHGNYVYATGGRRKRQYEFAVGGLSSSG